MGSHSIGTIGGGNKTDIALLKSLLPGVHITAGNGDFFGGASGWDNSMASASGLGQLLNPASPSGLLGEPDGDHTSQNQMRGQGIW
jgi:hypothetical protein